MDNPLSAALRPIRRPEEGRGGEQRGRGRGRGRGRKRRPIEDADREQLSYGVHLPTISCNSAPARLLSFRNPPLSHDDINATLEPPISLPPHYQEEGRGGEQRGRVRRRCPIEDADNCELQKSYGKPPRFLSFPNPPLSRDDINATPEPPISLPPHYQGATPGLPMETTSTTPVMASPPSWTFSSSSAMYYPFPSEVNVANFVPLKLGALSDYFVWKQLMLNLIRSHQLEGFIDGTIRPPPPFPFNVQEKQAYGSWKRSDGLVRGWVFVTVTEEILLQLVDVATAREAWIELEKMFMPSASSLPQSKPQRTYEERVRIASKYLPLYKAILNGDWATDTIFLPGIRGAITLESETALMVAVRSSGRNHIVTNLIEVMTEEEVAQRDINGETALFKAVQSGNYDAAMLLVNKNGELPSIMVQDTFAVHWAAMLGHREMVVYLLENTAVGFDPSPFEGPTGLQLLNCLAYGGLFDIALDFFQSYPKLASMEPSALEMMVHQHFSFYSGTRLNLVESLIYSCIPVTLEGNANRPVGTDVENPSEGVVSPWSYYDLVLRRILGRLVMGCWFQSIAFLEREAVSQVLVSQRLNATFWDVAEKLVPPIKSVRETKLMHHQALKFVKHLCEEAVKSEHFSRASDVLSGPMIDAATVGTCEIVEEILESFPSGIQRCNIKDQNIFHAAIENRQENVFNLIYQVEKNQRGVFLLRTDKSGNNALHMAGNLGPMQQLSLRASVACPALQMQRELQWFKAVEELFENSKANTRNNMRRTPQELFTDTHKDLVEKGEKWMKDTANSCTIVAALIVTVVFAAAITVPGGNNGDSGLPIFLGNRVFVLFGVSDSLALFSATTSLLTFLSILTSRYGEQDFLYSLPKKLIIGLFTLFLSIIAMMVTFGAALKIVFGHKREWITISGFALSCVPVALFAWLQFPLLVRLIKSTYFPGIFKKRSKPIFY